MKVAIFYLLVAVLVVCSVEQSRADDDDCVQWGNQCSSDTNCCPGLHCSEKLNKCMRDHIKVPEELKEKIKEKFDSMRQ